MVIALRTPYFGVVSPDGNVTIRDVPPGTYDLRVWAEGADPKELNGLGRRVEVASGQQDLGSLLSSTPGAREQNIRTSLAKTIRLTKRRHTRGCCLRGCKDYCLEERLAKVESSIATLLRKGQRSPTATGFPYSSPE